MAGMDELKFIDDYSDEEADLDIGGDDLDRDYRNNQGHRHRSKLRRQQIQHITPIKEVDNENQKSSGPDSFGSDEVYGGSTGSGHGSGHDLLGHDLLGPDLLGSGGVAQNLASQEDFDLSGPEGSDAEILAGDPDDPMSSDPEQPDQEAEDVKYMISRYRNGSPGNGHSNGSPGNGHSDRSPRDRYHHPDTEDVDEGDPFGLEDDSGLGDLSDLSSQRLQRKESESSGKAGLIQIIRSTDTTELEDVEKQSKDQQTLRSMITKAMVRQFQSDSDNEDQTENDDGAGKRVARTTESPVTMATGSSQVDHSVPVTDILEVEPDPPVTNLDSDLDSDLGDGSDLDLDNEVKVALSHGDSAPLNNSPQYESVSEELTSPTAHGQALSLKEELADEEEEREELSSSEEDTLCDLDEVTAEIEKRFPSPKAKERASTGSLDDIDFACLEPSHILSNEGSKMRVQLRQKGSLAKRRKPTRSTVRTGGGSDDDVFIDSSEPTSPQLNGHTRMNLGENGHASMETEKADVELNTHQLSSAPGPVLRTGKQIAGVKTAIVLPGLGENTPKLRSKPPPPQPAPKPVIQSEGTPPWLAETKLKRTSRPPRGEVEKLSKETEPEKPAWMKDAMAKKKRASLLLDKSGSVELSPGEEPPMAPWMRERVLKKSNRPAPLSTSVNNGSPGSPSPDTTGFGDSLDGRKPNKEVLSPITRTFPEIPPGENKENHSKATITEITPRKTLPTLQSTPSHTPSHIASHTPASASTPESSEAALPAWKVEAQSRRKSKSYMHPTHPVNPMKMFETPSWKQALLEKQKKRSESVGDSGGDEHKPQSPVVPPTSAEKTEDEEPQPPWKQEFAQRKHKRLSLVPPPKVPESEKTEEDATPDWMKEVRQRRARLASTGLIPTKKEEETS